ncbi:MAG: late competence development ComFB family protein [Lachnospiraceae bacterium]|nr:late competence development ComFB family protein [Lachnospiraceae bacterium]
MSIILNSQKTLVFIFGIKQLFGEWGTIMTQLVNLMEETVFNKIDELWPNTEYCKCEECRMDIATYALNRLPAQYVQSLKGKVMYRFEACQTQSDVDVTVIVGTAIGVVGNAPHRNTVQSE